MAQRELTVEQVAEIVGRVHYEKRFRVGEFGERADGYYVQIEYEEPDIRTGELAVQRGRKWYVSRFATESEIVQTCLRAALDSAEHQVREHFAYRPPHRSDDVPLLIYGPHFSADWLYESLAELADRAAAYDAREDPE